MKIRNTIVAVATIAASACALGCASELSTSGPQAPGSTLVIEKISAPSDGYLWSTTLEPVSVVTPEEAVDRTLVVNVSERVARACSDYNVPAPKVEFDSAKLSHEQNREFRALVQCIASGPLKNRRVHIIGDTDPRAGLEESVDLGEHQADTVKDFLTTHGVPRSRVLVTPRRDSLVEDRRVDIVLAGEALEH